MLKKPTLSLLFLLLSGFILPLQAHDNPYWEDSADNIIRSGSGCLRTSDWSMNNSLPECEGGMKKVAAVDSDNDGVIDSKDQCPDTAAGIDVNAQGCPMDSDGDGAADSYDRCPGTPKGVNVNATGCPIDSDGDGIADYIDNCTGTAKGVAVDANGCPRDSDGDGVADSNDTCPDTLAGTKVDAKGCAVSMDDDNDGIMNANDDCAGTAPGTAVNTRGCELKADIKLDNVQFKTGTANLSADSRNILDNVAQVLKENQHLNFEIAGHTDSSGNYKSNVKLSESRAQSVREYLIDKGVDAGRLTARGYGPDKPVASNDTRDGRKMNRRVELVLQ